MGIKTFLLNSLEEKHNEHQPKNSSVVNITGECYEYITENTCVADKYWMIIKEQSDLEKVHALDVNKQ